MGRSVLVVARFDEDTGWLGSLPDGWQPRIVQKDVDVPNEGREASSFLYAMGKLRSRPPSVVAFVQGNPFDHCPDLWERLAEPITGFTWLGGLCAAERDGSPHHPGLPIDRKLGEWCSGHWQGTIEFAAGGQFAIPGRYLKQHEARHYEWMMGNVSEGDGPWVMERLWSFMFRDE